MYFVYIPRPTHPVPIPIMCTSTWTTFGTGQREPPHILSFCQTMNEFNMTALDIVVVVVVLVVVVAAFYADKWITVIARNSIVVGSVLWHSFTIASKIPTLLPIQNAKPYRIDFAQRPCSKTLAIECTGKRRKYGISKMKLTTRCQ